MYEHHYLGLRISMTFDLKIFDGHCDLYFMVQWLCVVSWRLFDEWISYFGIMGQYDQTFDLKLIVGHCDLYFIVQWFYLISWRLFDVWTSLFGIMIQYNSTFDLKINAGHCGLYFTVKCFALYLEDFLMYERQYLGLWVLKINIGHCDLYFVVQWFCLLSWKLFYVRTSLFGTIWCMNIIIWDYESVWPEVWPQNKYGSLWPIFHGPLILRYILKTFWCMNIILWDYESV